MAGLALPNYQTSVILRRVDKGYLLGFLLSSMDGYQKKNVIFDEKNI